jgi:topoisomerase-4 subunit A
MTVVIKRPVTLPAKFPLLLVQGAEGIAVGLSSKILPHNFNEVCDAAVSYLQEGGIHRSIPISRPGDISMWKK